MPSVGRTRARRLNGATLMQSSLCLNVGFMCSFWRLKDAKIRALAFADDTSHKSAWMPYHTKQSSRAGALGRVLVLGVRSPTDLAQIGKDIVGFVAVHVVNLLRRPFASHVQKRKLVCHATEAVKHDINVTIASQRTDRHSGFFPSFGLQVSELPSFWTVMRKFAQTGLCNHVAPHQSGLPSKVAASGDESPVPRQVSCKTILQDTFAKSIICGKIVSTEPFEPPVAHKPLHRSFR